jgi:hypothetical protein
MEVCQQLQLPHFNQTNRFLPLGLWMLLLRTRSFYYTLPMMLKMMGINKMRYVIYIFNGVRNILF